MKSIISYPDRGHWGKSNWRGNASGHVYKDLFEQFKPKLFVDPMVGSGTSVEVAKEMGIEAIGLDLHSGFNALRDSIHTAIGGRQADLVVSHPPYGAMIKYSGNVWGTTAHPDDLSHCASDDDFHEKMQRVLFNQRCATTPGGIYGALIGDWRRGGVYTSYQAEMIARMPRNELASVIIKAQHNCVSDRTAYSSMRMPMIVHEYLLLWQKKAAPMLLVMSDFVSQTQQRLQGTWKAIVMCVMQRMAKPITLDKVYECIARHASEKLASNPNWQAKVRQVLNSSPEFVSSERGVWALA